MPSQIAHSRASRDEIVATTWRLAVKIRCRPNGDQSESIRIRKEYRFELVVIRSDVVVDVEAR